MTRFLNQNKNIFYDKNYTIFRIYFIDIQSFETCLKFCRHFFTLIEEIIVSKLRYN
jgi:hypothetical protein